MSRAREEVVRARLKGILSKATVAFHSADLPASEEAISSAETELGHKLPPSYRAFIKMFGAGAVAGFELYGVVEETGIWCNIVQVNSKYDEETRERYIEITHDGGDLFLCFDVKETDDTGEYSVVCVGGGYAREKVVDSFYDVLEIICQGRDIFEELS